MVKMLNNEAYLRMMFLDTLSFLKTNGEWKIYNKLFTEESIN